MRFKEQDYIARFSLPVLFSLGFRPFYLAGSLYAAIGMAIWVGYIAGFIAINGPFDGALWHAHELIFGFAVAILFGFLYTAGANWTRLSTPSGIWLAGLICLWAAARIGLVISDHLIVVLLDLAFLPLAAVGLAIPLFRSHNRRNYFVLGLLTFLWLANIGFYAVSFDWIELDTGQLHAIAIGVFALFISIIGGRVVPFFTNNAITGNYARKFPWLEHATAVSLIASIALDVSVGPDGGPVWLRVGVLSAVIVLHSVKIVGWRPWVMRSRPILWILPLAYSWLPIGFLLRALALLDSGLDPMLGLHAITAGAMGSMMLAMMTRTSLGHTGRAIHAGAIDLAIYLLITACAAIRVFAPLLLPDYYIEALSVSGLLWALAFLVFFVRYWPILTRPRFF